MNYGWISETGAFAQKPLLGKPCGDYVKAAMAEIELVDSAERLGKRKADGVLVVRQDAPCLQEKTLLGLLEASREEPCALISLDTETALAVAVSGEVMDQLLAEKPTLPGLDELVALIHQKGKAIRLWHDELAETYFAVNDAKHYAEAFRMLNAATLERHQKNGVILLDPDRTIIEADVQIGAGTMIYAGNMLCGATRIGSDCVLYPNNRMQDAAVGQGATVESSVLLNCVVGEHTTVGPYAYLRPDTKIGDHCRIGDFVEVKNSSIDDGTKVSHLTYVGDSDLGKDINLGCGVVFVNYDGKVKNRSKVEDHAFIGCNCNLVAPVHVGKNAYLAAGSTIVEDVPDDALFVARSRGVVKEDWVKRRKEAGKL
ncbi:MAG: hypothetical protein PHI98_00880 [Eubacteriales bacterium]|nr:hypothetical protein [Eubacteriales bacterium]